MWTADCSDAGASLDEQGTWFCDDAVDEVTASELRRDILDAHSAGLLLQSGNKLALRGADGCRTSVMQDKPHIFEADVIANGQVEREDVLQHCPVLARLLGNEEALRRLLNRSKPELCLERLEQAKVQVNVGSQGAFPLHFDVPSAEGSRRLLTAILYLNPEWTDGDGGEVELLPFPFSNSVVAPTCGRLVTFSSNTTMHRVRPFSGAAGRVCINLWFDGDVTIPFPAPLPPKDHDAQAARIVNLLRKRPQELRAFCKVWYRQEIAASFVDAFRPCPELDAVVKLHHEEATEVETRIATVTLEKLRGCLPLEPQVEQNAGELEDLFAGM